MEKCKSKMKGEKGKLFPDLFSDFPFKGFMPCHFSAFLHSEITVILRLSSCPYFECHNLKTRVGQRYLNVTLCCMC